VANENNLSKRHEKGEMDKNKKHEKNGKATWKSEERK
jgi:hypothetical protein